MLGHDHRLIPEPKNSPEVSEDTEFSCQKQKSARGAAASVLSEADGKHGIRPKKTKMLPKAFVCFYLDFTLNRLCQVSWYVACQTIQATSDVQLISP